MDIHNIRYNFLSAFCTPSPRANGPGHVCISRRGANDKGVSIPTLTGPGTIAREGEGGIETMCQAHPTQRGSWPWRMVGSGAPGAAGHTEQRYTT